MKKFWKALLAGALALGCFAIAACGAQTQATRNIGGSAAYTEQIVAENLNRKIVYTVNLTIKTAEITQTRSALHAKCESLGGYIESTDEDFSGGECIYAFVSYRIPTENLDGFVADLESQGGVTGKTVYSADITASYVDATAKRDALLAEKKMLEELLSQEGVSAGDKVTVISRISEVNEALYAIEQTIALYDSMVNYSTVYVELSKPISAGNIALPIILGIAIAGGVFSAIFFPIRTKRRKKKHTTE